MVNKETYLGLLGKSLIPLCRSGNPGIIGYSKKENQPTEKVRQKIMATERSWVEKKAAARN